MKLNPRKVDRHEYSSDLTKLVIHDLSKSVNARSPGDDVMPEAGFGMDRGDKIDLLERLAARTGVRPLKRCLLREEMYDPISGVTITIWSPRTSPMAENRWN